MNRFCTHLPEPMLAKLRKLAVKRGITIAEIVRSAIADYLSRNVK